ncbi:MtnX-like HAD-IB family phosphatase [Chloroflexota bacterium]
MKEEIKTLVQCDFDGTVTEEDVSFIILDAFSGTGWRQLFRDYQEGKLTVGRFNAEAFSGVKADKKSLVEVVRREAKVRSGLRELVDCCRRKGYRFVIVSNGLQFYIEEIVYGMGITGVEVFAAKTEFSPDGLKVQYVGPDGSFVDNDVKAAYVDSFVAEGYRVVYIGDGLSDTIPAGKSHYVFATRNLPEHCRKANIVFTPFSDLSDIVGVIESWQ